MCDIKSVLTSIKNKFDETTGRNIYLLFACNTTGKTRLSRLFEERFENGVLCYNAFMEDLFHWDNENTALLFDRNSWLAELIKTEGLEIRIIDNFKKVTISKIEPLFDLDAGNVVFRNYSVNGEDIENIKVSRGEESLFIWSIFYTILAVAIETLRETPDDRSTHFFDNIKYIVIDDPVSSMDDTRIITMSLDLIELLKSIPEQQDSKILITTHHYLFYNVMYRRKRSNWNQYNAILVKKEDGELFIENQSGDSPLPYHIVVLKEIKNAISGNRVQKYHFNLFRALLEKTANFLGYTGAWSNLLEESDNKDKLTKLLNLYSHSSLAEIESKEISPEELALFQGAFSTFITHFHWNLAL